MKRRLNWSPSLPDKRDFKHVLSLAMTANLPPSVDLRPLCPPIVDQGDIGSCSGNAAAANRDFLQMLELRTKAAPNASPDEYGLTFEPTSRLFIYYNERTIEGTTDTDSGVTTLRDACKALTKWGACPEVLWAYDDGNTLVKPDADAYTEAAKHKDLSYCGISGNLNLKHCLANGFPFMLGITIYDSFQTDEVAATGIVPMPASSESVDGGHAVLCVGYDDVKQVWIIRNSWGTDWGMAGYFTLPYAYFDEGLANDFFSLRKV